MEISLLTTSQQRAIVRPSHCTPITPLLEGDESTFLIFLHNGTFQLFFPREKKKKKNIPANEEDPMIDS